MQNKGLVRIFAGLLTLVCVFYLSFSFVTGSYNKKAKTYANGDPAKEYHYLDSVGAEKVWLGYTLKECREKEINLGLDLKGGMNITMEVSVADILKALSGYNTTENFNQALKLATERQQSTQADYLTLFVQAYQEIDPNAKLSAIFSTFELKDKISSTSTNAEVESILREEVEGAIDNSFNVLRTRIDRFGVVQPNIQKLDQQGRILIELPGIKEPERVRKLLQGSANLEFWETYEMNEIAANLIQANALIAEMQRVAEPQETATEEVVEETPAVETQDSVASAVDSLAAQLTANNTEAEVADNAEAIEKYKKENPLFAVLQPSLDQAGQAMRGPVVGIAHYSDTVAVNKYLGMKQVRELMPRDLQFRWTVKAFDEAGYYYQLVAIKVTNRDGRAPLEGSAVTDARADFSQSSVYANVSMTMNAEGAKTWARLTKENIGKSIAIALDGYIYSFPTVQTEITGGSSSITGNFSVEEAKDLANTLKSGKMPAPARIVQEDVVGPSLGEAAIKSGLISFIIAFCLVLLYMICYYGLIPGLIADLALFANVFFLMGILASFSAVLTLPGIAGIVLTLGMAVDANVLIYERVREEMAAGKNMRKAIADGFGNAISAIVDANLTTLITGIILAVFGTGPIKGFAVTLIIGIVTSFVTAVFITRLLLDLYARRENAQILQFTTNFTKKWFRNLNINFIDTRKIGYIISGAMIVAALCGLLFQGLNYGVDFSGGRNYVVRFEQSVNTEDVRELLEDAFDGAGVQVISIGADNQVRISTKYRIQETGEQVDNDIITVLYENLKPMLADGLTLEQFANESILSSQKVGPSIADDIKTSAVWAILFAMIAIFLYIFIRFRDFAFSVGTLVALAHDVIIIMGIYALVWPIMPFSLEIDQAFIAAILTIIGYSVNDTVVIFDRVRENVGLYPKRDRKSIINESLNVTLSRTFSTSMSTGVTVLAIFFFGGETIRGFIFAMLLGVILGTYSTLYVAVPVAYDVMNRKRNKAVEAQK
ncbi:MAG: protein translocase subunit SecDF [Paludibacteraceae bacterium]|nr:protein translocase subunit SecDF [Paludibacteraceae bacterium]